MPVRFGSSLRYPLKLRLGPHCQHRTLPHRQSGYPVDESGKLATLAPHAPARKDTPFAARPRGRVAWDASGRGPHDPGREPGTARAAARATRSARSTSRHRGAGHSDGEQPADDDDGCVVTLFAQGLVLPLAFAALAFTGRKLRLLDFELADRVAPESPRYLRLPTQAPPTALA